MKRLLIIFLFVLISIPARNKLARYYGPAGQMIPIYSHIEETIDTVWYNGELIEVTRISEVNYILTRIK